MNIKELANKAELLKKLSTKTMIGKVKFPATATEGATLPLFRVFGRVSGIESGESTFGMWTALGGDFLAVTEDGKAYRSGKLFLPDIATDLVVGAVTANPGAALNIAFAIYAKRDDTAAVGYVYGAKPLMPMQTDTDPVLALAESLMEDAALPAPEAEKPAEAEKPTGKKK